MDITTFWKTTLPSLTDEGAIVSKLIKDYNAKDNATTSAAVHLVWSAWPGVSKKVGAWVQNGDQKPFLNEIVKVTGLTYRDIEPIAMAIVDLGKEGALAQKNVDPTKYIQAQTQNKAAIEATNEAEPNYLSKLLGITSGTITWIKWGAIGIGILALLFFIRPYTAPVLAKISQMMKARQAKREVKENPAEIEDDSEVEE